MLTLTKEHTTQSKVQSKSKSFVPPSSVIQKKLSVGSTKDVYEVEADRMADQVVQMKPIAVDKPKPTNRVVQRTCKSCEDEDRNRKKPLSEQVTTLIQRRESNPEGRHLASSDLSSKISQPRGGGDTLDKNTKNSMEQVFGADFSNVRIHTDSKAINLSRELNAQAFTVGNDIYFNDGKYNTTTASGKHLLAHELTHTIQLGNSVIRKSVSNNQTNYRFDTYQINNSDLENNVILERFESMSLENLLIYFRNVNNEDVKQFVWNLILQIEPNANIPNFDQDSSSPIIIRVNGAGSISNHLLILNKIREEYNPLARLVGREIQFTRINPGHIEMDFVRSGGDTAPCRLSILGNAGGSIFVGAHENLRLCGTPRHLGNGVTTHGDQMARVFRPGERAFALFVANTAVHEIGHVIGLDHVSSNRENYMFSHPRLGGNLPVPERTMRTMRENWAGPKVFDASQRNFIISRFLNMSFTGGMQVQTQTRSRRLIHRP